MHYRYILFDMDGVLVDSERTTYEIWKDYFARYGLDLTVDMYIGLCGRSNDEVGGFVAQHYPQVEADGLVGYWEDTFAYRVDNGLLPVKAGAYALFDAMDAKGTRRAVASSNLRYWVERNLRAAGLYDRVEAFATDGDVAACKPAPDLFLLAAQRLGAQPGECLVVEDSVSGVLAGKAAGCDVALIPDLLLPPADILARCDYILDDLSGVIPLL